jgi:hypothetical protein
VRDTWRAASLFCHRAAGPWRFVAQPLNTVGVRSYRSPIVGNKRARHCAGRSLDESDYTTEARIVSGSQPLEYYHLRCHDLCSIPLHSPDRRLLAF